MFTDILPITDVPVPADSLSFDELLRSADIVSLHVPLTEATRRLIDSDALGRMRAGAILLNTSRGAVVDCVALADALIAGVLGGAGLDVVDPEPLPPGHPLLTAPNTLLTAHIGARTIAGQARMSDVVDDVLRVLAGQSPHFAAPT